MGDTPQSGWAGVELLSEPTRRRIYQAVRAARAPMTREAAAAATGTSRRLAAFHLDQLAAAGLLSVDFARPGDRTGPGAGRPAKRYAMAAGDVAVSVPARRYDLAARLLARGIRQSAGTRATEATLQSAADEGRRLGADRRTAKGRRPGERLSRPATVACAEGALADLGYEPTRRDEGLRLGNCPFHAVVDEAPELVCGMSHRLVEGLLAGLEGHPDVVAELDPAPPDCCVRVLSPG